MRIAPDHLNEYGRNAWYRLQAQAIGKSLWKNEFSIYLEHVAYALGHYVDIANKYKNSADNVSIGNLTDARITARLMLVEWNYIPDSRINISTLNNEGIDVDIAKICAFWSEGEVQKPVT